MQGSSVLGIVGCYSLSDQIMHLIERDEEIDNLLIVKNEEGLQFVKKLEERSVSKNYQLISEDESLQRDRGFSIRLWLNPEDIHNDPSLIQHKQSEALSKISMHVDSILFCYGLCRSSEQRIANLIKQAMVPVTFLTDASGEIVDDCFAAILGGKKIYLDHIKKHKGTLFASTGYAETWKRKRERADIEAIVHEVDDLRYMFETLGYHSIMKLDDGTGDRERFDDDVRIFSRTFDLELERKECHLRVFEQSYQLAKERMGGPLGSLEVLTEEPSLTDAVLPEQFSMLGEIKRAGRARTL